MNKTNSFHYWINFSKGGHMQRVFILRNRSFFFLNILLISLSCFKANSYTPEKVVKWYPGHYLYRNDPNYSATNMNILFSELASTPEFKGIQLVYPWKSLENAKGSYDFSLIDRDIAFVKKYNKKLSIILGFKYQVLPDYIYAIKPKLVGDVMVPSYFHQKPGEFTGDIANFGHPDTFTGYSDLMKEIVRRYDNDLNVAYIQITETASSADPAKYPNLDQLEVSYLNGIYKMQALMGTIFLHTPVIQSLNSPRGELESFILNITNYHLGFGGPDTFFGAFDSPDDPLTKTNSDGASPGIYNYNLSNFGVLPIGMQVHQKNLQYSSILNLRADIPHNYSGPDSVQAVYFFAKNTLGSNFLAWQVSPTDIYLAPLKARLIDRTVPLKEDCPKIYLACNYSGAIVVNKAPVLVSPIANKSWVEGSNHSFTVPLSTFSDPNGDPLTYTARQSNGSALPAWLSFNASTRVLSGKPPVGIKNYTIRIRVKDPGGLSVYDDFTLSTPAL